MDLIDRLQDIAIKIPRLMDNLETEEATKNALIMPFINALGYNVFDPSEVVPEFTADVGTKKGEKVDYAVMQDSKPIILFECKKAKVDLETEHASQLYRYFTTTHARLGILTNGIQYKIYSDLDKINVMDKHPFFELDMRELNDRNVDELKKFTKSVYDIEDILLTANDLKYRKGLKRILMEEWINPSDEFVKLLAKRVYDGAITQAVREQFTSLTKKAFQEFVSERINERLKSALDSQANGNNGTDKTNNEETTPSEADEDISEIVTTNEEIEGFFIIKSILRETIDVKRVYMRDTVSYCGVLLDDNNRKPICRMHFNRNQKYIGLIDQNKAESRVPIEDLSDIYKYADHIKKRAEFYIDEIPEIETKTT